APVHAGAARRRPRAGHDRADEEPRRPRGAARPGEPAAGLSLPPALPARRGRVPRAGAAAPRGTPRARRRLPLRGTGARALRGGLMATGIGVEVGGTFTDLVTYDDERGDVRVVKEPTTPAAPEEGVIEAVRRGVPERLLRTAEFFLHGTTVGLNAL